MFMQDVHEIRNLLYEYCWRIDSGDFDGVCELLKDADILYGGKLTYHKDPKGYMMTLKPICRYEDGTTKTCHMCIDPIIEVAPDGLTATAKSYTVCCRASPARWNRKSFGLTGNSIPWKRWRALGALPPETS